MKLPTAEHHPPPATSAAADTTVGLRVPDISATADRAMDQALGHRLRPAGFPTQPFGQLEALAMQLARVQGKRAQALNQLHFDLPQVLVFAGDHGVADEGVCAFRQEVTVQRAQAILEGKAPVNALAKLHGFAVTLVDSGMATPMSELTQPLNAELPSNAPTLLLRKIGHGTRNMVLSPAMSVPQAVSAIHAGMDVVRHLPGNVLALGDVGMGNEACAALILSRLCGVPLADACGEDPDLDAAQRRHQLEKLFAAATRHRKAASALDVLATMGGYEIAMLVGAMLQAASERRVVLLDGFACAAAALVARALAPACTDYLVFAHRTPEAGHRLALLHLQAQPVLDLELRVGQGVGALMVWPVLLAAQSLLQG